MKQEKTNVVELNAYRNDSFVEMLDAVTPEVIQEYKEEKQKRKPKSKVDPSTFAMPQLAESTFPIDRVFHKFFNLGKTEGGIGKFRFEGNTLIHRTYQNYGATEVIDVVARRIVQDGKTYFIGNSSVLRGIGQRVNFGYVRANRNETEIQRRLSTMIPMIPFNVFIEAKLDIEKMRIIARGPAETVTRNRQEWNGHKTVTKKEKVHYTGASLFSVDGKCFLFDIDRVEIEHGIFNAFLVELVKPAKTIEQAYESLKPKAVKQAEKSKLEVLRQGEWFFIPTDKRMNSKLEKLKGNIRELALRAGPNRPNITQGVEFRKGKLIPNMPKEIQDLGSWTSEFRRWEKKNHVGAKGNTVYVTGFSKHSGREHKDLILKRWYTVVPNTSVGSFQINGDID